ncbi:hypothetical protein BS47DRAFT_1447297 [Hydnum rufescens UP504]|uniref:40S ribosomal protein S16 n=1 Tax=Hydnum rufescens UP504 TaxID=1448309 RepID=A0A9P6B1D5_9AGAM|nr:hypothetical protein BS47DRAFT_1447297 [Hydnum rufescens UP504]
MCRTAIATETTQFGSDFTHRQQEHSNRSCARSERARSHSHQRLPVNLVQPEILRYKIYEPVLVVGEGAFSHIDIRVRVKGGGHVSQVYAIRQAIAKALVAYYAKYEDAAEAISLKKALVAYDRTLLHCRSSTDGTEKVRWCGCPCSETKEVRVDSRFFVWGYLAVNVVVVVSLSYR